MQLEKEKFKLKQQKSEDRANDEDVGFFISLLPHVKTLNPRTKNFVQAESSRNSF